MTRPPHLAWIAAALVALAAAPSLAEPDRRESVERYRIEGAPEADGCGGRIVLAARHLVLDRGRGRLFADVVNRTYSATYNPAGLVARGTFDGRGACPSGVAEEWELRYASATELRGTLASTWHMAPSCRPCTVTFRLRAVRVR